MEIPVIVAFIGISLIYRLLFKNKGKAWFIFLTSIFFVFYFQPISTIRYLDFWISTFTLSISVFLWEVISPENIKKNKETKLAYLILASAYGLISFLRYFPQQFYASFTSVPPFAQSLVVAAVFCLLILLIRSIKKKNLIFSILTFLILIIFVFIKNSELSLLLSRTLRNISGQSLTLAKGSEIIWVGYSYFAFRILHVLFEYRKKNLENFQLHTFVGYLLFFPAFLAGPIMLVDKFQTEVGKENKFDKEVFLFSTGRIAAGLLQKFIIADLLAVISLNETIGFQVSEAKWMWLFTIAYALRIFFDFSGYSHIAIGIAALIGLRMPENFNKPLISPTLTLFWNNWHITLTQWFRSYYFNPITRYLRKNFRNLNPITIMAFMQITTMVLIGLWHGISWNFIFWGLWIGVGLFIQNQISSSYQKGNDQNMPFWQIGLPNRIMATFFTFLYVSMGWVWFALPKINSSIHVFKILIGIK